jgi:hypothetical protein
MAIAKLFLLATLIGAALAVDRWLPPPPRRTAIRSRIDVGAAARPPTGPKGWKRAVPADGVSLTLAT